MSSGDGKLWLRAVVVGILVIIGFSIPGPVDDAVLIGAYVFAHGKGMI